jgi:hypothetical protein
MVIDTGRPSWAHNPDSAPNYVAQAIKIVLTIMCNIHYRMRGGRTVRDLRCFHECAKHKWIGRLVHARVRAWHASQHLALRSRLADIAAQG